VNSSWTHRRSSRHPNPKCIPSGYCLPSSELAKLGQKPEGLLGEQDDITQRLHAWRNGEQGALDSLIPAVYPELHRMALAFVRNESKGSGTLQATGLVNELYLVLVNRRKVDFEQRNQHKSEAAQMQSGFRSAKTSTGSMQPARKCSIWTEHLANSPNWSLERRK
jgi:hypothetical protein